MLDQFRSEGYQIVNDVIDCAALEAIRWLLERGADDALEQIRIEGNAARSEPEIAKLISGHLPIEYRLNRTFWTVTQCPGMRSLLMELFPGQKIGMHLPPAARYVVPGNRYAMVPAHQDAAYNRHMPDFVTVWIPFVPIDNECGGVAVYQGTHNLSLRDPGGRGTFWYDGLSHEGKIIPCNVPLGGALLLSPTIIHASRPNTSKRTRYSIDYRFFGKGGSSKHYLDLETMAVVAP